MTIDELWQNLKPLIGKVDKLEPLVGKVDNLETKVNRLEPLVGKVDNLEMKVDRLEPLVEEVRELKNEVHKIGTTNMTTLINQQTSFSKQQREMNEKLDKYLDKNEVEHKKFEYEIANLEWKIK